jgi:hypothetical protein
MVSQKTASKPLLCLLFSQMVITSVYAEIIFNEEFSKLDLGYNTRGRHTWFLMNSLGTKLRPSLLSTHNGILTLTTLIDSRYGVNTSIVTFPDFKQDGTAKVPLFRYGYFEARIRFDPNEDNWPAFWLNSEKLLLHATQRLSDEIEDHACEIDVFEGIKKRDAYGGTVHDWKWGSDPHNISNDNNQIPIPAGADFRNWNIFGVNWTPQRVSWYMNGQLMSSWPTPEVCKSAELFIIIGAQKFGGARSQTLDVNWIRASSPKPDQQ